MTWDIKKERKKKKLYFIFIVLLLFLIPAHRTYGTRRRRLHSNGTFLHFMLNGCRKLACLSVNALIEINIVNMCLLQWYMRSRARTTSCKNVVLMCFDSYRRLSHPLFLFVSPLLFFSFLTSYSLLWYESCKFHLITLEVNEKKKNITQTSVSSTRMIKKGKKKMSNLCIVKLLPIVKYPSFSPPPLPLLPHARVTWPSFSSLLFFFFLGVPPTKSTRESFLIYVRH